MRRIAFILACLAVAPAATAKPADPGIAGAWHFSSVAGPCHFEGDIAFKRAAAKGVYDCSFIVFADCGHRPGGWRVRETCHAVQTGDAVLITSAVDKILENRTTLPAANYRPDNFDLTLTPDRAEMVGTQADVYRNTYKSTFRRAGALVS